RYADERAKRVGGKVVPFGHESRDKPSVRPPIATEVRGRRVDRSLEEDSRPVIERVREGRGRLDPLESLPREIELAEERRRSAERMECGANVVHESGKGQLTGATAASDRLVRLIHGDGVALAHELDRGGEP